jgi:hypothetical protein
MYTDEDLSQLPRNGVSIVGPEASASASSAAGPNSSVRPPRKANQSNTSNTEKEWRSRARKFQDQVSFLDGQIAKVRENIAYADGRGYDIHVDILDLSLDDLLKQKAALQKQIDALEEEARKAGADPGWLR